MTWKAIESAPKDGKIILVNDTTVNGGETAPWVAAVWEDDGTWSGWQYAEVMIAECNPDGPKPTFWMGIPDVNGPGWMPIATAPKDKQNVLVNETFDPDSGVPWVAARWLEIPGEWSGWIYSEGQLANCVAGGPEPTVWFDVPAL
jgi:hypothetical protein